MKKYISVFLLLAIACFLCSCGSMGSGTNKDNSTAPEHTDPVQQRADSYETDNVVPGQAVKRLRCTFDDGTVAYIEDLTETVTTREFISLLPMNITLSDWDQREYYIARQLPYEEADTQTSYVPGEFTYWCGGWITAYYDTNEDTVIEAGSVVIGMMDEVFLLT